MENQIHHIERMWSQSAPAENISEMAEVTAKAFEDFLEVRIAHWIWIIWPPFIFVVGTVGNVLSFLVMRRPALAQMSTALYLAVIALLDTCGLWSGMVRHWIKVVFEYDVRRSHEVICKLQRFLLYSSLNSSVWILVAVTVERFVSVYYPVRAKIWCSLARSRLYIYSIVAAMCVFNAPVFWTRGRQYVSNKYGNDSFYIGECGYTSKAAMYYWHVILPWIVMIIYPVAPFLLMTVCNIFIARRLLQLRRLRRNMRMTPANPPASGNATVDHSNEITGAGRSSTRTKRAALASRQTSDSEKEKDKQLWSLTVTLLVVTLVFLLLASPSLINLFNDTFNVHVFDKSPAGRASEELQESVVLALMYTNHSINFFLYVATGARFRRELTIMLYTWKKRITNDGARTCCYLTDHMDGSARPPEQLTAGNLRGQQREMTILVNPHTTNGNTSRAGLLRQVEPRVSTVVEREEEEGSPNEPTCQSPLLPKPSNMAASSQITTRIDL